MKTLRNKTRLPIRIALHGGKVLHLGPGKTGQVADKAAEAGSVRKLVDQDRIEILDGAGGGSQGGSDARPVPGSRQGHGQPRLNVPKGDR